MGCHCLQYTVTPSILQPHVLSLMQRLPEAIFQQDLGLTRQGVTRLSLHCYYPSLVCPIPRFVSNRAYSDNLGWRVGHPTSLDELEARLQQIWYEMSLDIIQNLYAPMPDRVASC
ncbi:uncharacterized protein TNCV_3858121 [Trichonephila clavipes]|nr:uncharacterized protein TNCV_3858121 [Trichonephila clavipes]